MPLFLHREARCQKCLRRSPETMAIVSCTTILSISLFVSLLLHRAIYETILCSCSRSCCQTIDFNLARDRVLSVASVSDRPSRDTTIPSVQRCHWGAVDSVATACRRALTSAAARSSMRRHKIRHPSTDIASILASIYNGSSGLRQTVLFIMCSLRNESAWDEKLSSGTAK